MKRPITQFSFDTLATLMRYVKQHQSELINMQDETQLSQIVDYFKTQYLQSLQTEQTTELTKIILNKVLDILDLLVFYHVIDRVNDHYYLNATIAEQYTDYDACLNLLVSCFKQENEFNQAYEQWTQTANLKLALDKNLLIKINLAAFCNQQPGIKEWKKTHLTLVDVLDQDFLTSLKKLTYTNAKEYVINYLKTVDVINNITNTEKLSAALASNKNAYIGFDPSASSLHLGNYVMINVINILKKYGVNVLPMVGGATGSIGDPSGKKSERQLQSEEVILANKLKIIHQLKKHTNADVVLDNLENFAKMNYLTFLRDVGKLININYMLEKDIIKSRLETGISYTEFSYTLMQGYDFAQFYKNYNVAIQIGGSDQWGNITTGVEMVRKMYGDNNLAVGFTINLLTKADGTKFGKSEKGAVFLDETLTSVYQMYQFLINQADADAIKLLRFLTTLDPFIINVINEVYQQPALIKLRIPQNVLAKELITKIHGENAYENVLMIAKCLFNNDIKSLSKQQLIQAFKNIPFFEVNKSTMNIVDLLVAANVCSSKREAREMLSNNSITVNGEKTNDLDLVLDSTTALYNLFTIIRKGKKNYFVIKWNK